MFIGFVQLYLSDKQFKTRTGHMVFLSNDALLRTASESDHAAAK